MEESNGRENEFYLRMRYSSKALPSRSNLFYFFTKKNKCLLKIVGVNRLTFFKSCLKKCLKCYCVGF